MSSFVEGQINQLVNKLEAVGFTAKDLAKFGQLSPSLLLKIRDVIHGKAQISYPCHMIDCDVDPVIPDGWSVEEHVKGGQFSFDPMRVKLWLSKAQQKGDVIIGNKLRKELKDQSVLNACVLDYLLAHQDAIPEEWKGKAVFFWGTIYRYSYGNLCVRYLCWDGGGWDWDNNWLGSHFSSRSPAAVSASI